MGHNAPANASNQEPEISVLVATHVNNLDDKGKLQLPDDMPEWQKHVIRSEKRQRDAQSELSKTQVQLQEASAVNEVLLSTAKAVVPSDFQLSDAEIAELESIKFKDPDAYRLRINELETKARAMQTENLTKVMDEAKTKASQSYQAKDRITVLHEFRAANPTLVITDDVLVNDVPARLINGVTDGKYDYAEYLEKVKAYLVAGTTVPKGDGGDPHNMHQTPGSQTPGKKAADNAGKDDYKKMTF